MNDKDLLTLLEKDGRLTTGELADKLGCSEGEVQAAIKRLENDKVILGYTALVDWDKKRREYVSAMIELKITPLRGDGFDKVATRIKSYPQVKNVYLMSGGYDILVHIEGKTLTEVALFVAAKLATMEGVVSTATHFVLKKYKDKGFTFDVDAKDYRSLFNI